MLNNEEGLAASRLLVSVPEFSANTLSIELIQQVNTDPSVLTQNPALLELFKPVPWLLPKRYPGLPYSNLSSRDLAVVAAARALPKGGYQKAISVTFFSKGMIRMLQNAIYTMVKFGDVDNYIVATWSESDLDACLDLNLPCADASKYLPEIKLEKDGEDDGGDDDEDTSTETEIDSIRDISYGIEDRIERIQSNAAASEEKEQSGDGETFTRENFIEEKISARALLQMEPEVVVDNSTFTNPTAEKAKSEVPEFESTSYNRIMWLKPAVVAFLLDENYVVHSTDIDLSYASKPVWESYLMYLHVAPGASAVDATFQIEGDGSYGSPINSGNFVALPTQGTKKLFAAWLALASEKIAQGGNQKGLQKLFHEDRYILCRTAQECQNAMKKRDQIAQEILLNSTAPPHSMSSSSGENNTNTPSEAPLLVPPTVIRTFTPPWWSTKQNFCALSGESRLPEMDPCSPAFFFLHPVCTPTGSDRVGLKTRVLDKAGLWFIDSKYGCPVEEHEMQNLSFYYEKIVEVDAADAAAALSSLSGGDDVFPQNEGEESSGKVENLFNRRRRLHRVMLTSPSVEKESMSRSTNANAGAPMKEESLNIPREEQEEEVEVEVEVEEEEDTGFDQNEDLSIYSGRGRQGLERCVPLELHTPKRCRISEFVSDPTNATAGIQAAVNTCSPGGTVIFDVPHTNYSTGSIFITGASVHIQLPGTVRLLAGIYREDYPGPQPYWYLLNFNNCHGCSLSGSGIIDGQAREYITGYLFDRAVLRDFEDPSCFNPWECRPRMLGIVNSTEIIVSGSIKIVDPIYWTVHIIGSKKVSLRGLTILGDWQVFNNDGIDIDSSEDVDIVGCHIDTADDAVCIKTTLHNTPMSRLRVEDCRLRSRAAAIKVGSESVADIRNLLFENIEIYNTHRGLAIQLRDQGSVSNVLFKNISATLHHEEYSWWGASEAIYVTAEPRFKKYGKEYGFVRNVTFKDIKIRSENGIFIDGGGVPSPSNFIVVEKVKSGIPSSRSGHQQQRRGGRVVEVEQHVIGVTISNLDLVLRNKTSWEGGYQDYRPCQQRDVQHSGGTAAVWIEGSRNIFLKDVNVEYVAPKRRDWNEVLHIEKESVDDIEMKRCSFGEIPQNWKGRKF